MWILDLFTKPKDNEREEAVEQSTNENNESINTSSNNKEEELILDDLKNRVEHVKTVHDKLQALQNKQDSNLNNDTTNNVQEKDEQCVSTNDNEKNVEINNSKIEDVLRIIPVLEENLQTLTEKVNINRFFNKIS